MSGVFSQVGGAHPRRSTFDLSYDKKMTVNFGDCNIVMCDEVVPGDVVKLGCQAVYRFNPLLAPILHEINAYTNYFFIPYRILWDLWETFITRGKTGDETPSLPRFVSDGTNGVMTALGTIWDQLGLPVGVNPTGLSAPIDMPWRAYNKVWNDYYRDENLQQECALVPDINDEITYSIKKCAMKKDYFTSALTSQQRGSQPALPIGGTTSAVWTSNIPLLSEYSNGSWSHLRVGSLSTSSPANTNLLIQGSDTTYNVGIDSAKVLEINANSHSGLTALNSNTVDLSGMTTADVSDLRLMFQIQKLQERNNRAGIRYTEFLRANYGVAPRDDRLQRPEYIGGTRTPIIVSEVAQTSQTSGQETATGTLYGKGVGLENSFVGKYRVQEFGVIMGIMRIVPKPTYMQGINRQWLRRTSYDFFNPLFVGLSEQQIENEEIYCQDDDGDRDNENRGGFGFQGMYDEMRYKPSLVTGKMRDDFDFWHCARKFSTLPHLNEKFITCNNADFSRILAVPSEPPFIVNFRNDIKAVRPIPYIAEPGFIDHF